VITRALLVMAIGMLGAALASIRPAAAAPNSGTVYRVTYFEAAAPDIGKAGADVRQFAAASRKEVGNAGFAAFQEIARPSRFAIVEAWQDKASADAHNAAAAAVAFRNQVQPLLVGPFEVRTLTGFSIAPPNGRGGRDAVDVLIFVDVFLVGKERTRSLLTQVAEASRKLPGNLRFDVLLRADGPGNHFIVVEGWRDRRAFAASATAAPAHDFRQQLTPLEGALYDQRLYQPL
jgi:quinol monooxygenase YgiN